MANKIQLSAKLDQRLGMNQQLKEAIQLLQYSTLELAQMVKQQIETNPLLELSEEVEEKSETAMEEALEPQYTANTISSRNVSFDGGESAFENISVRDTLRQHLLAQTLNCHFSTRDQIIAETFVNSLEENGRLTCATEDILHMLEPEIKPSLEDLERVLKIIQTFDPPGVGARSVGESLRIQLESISERDAAWHLAWKILNEAGELSASLMDIKKWLQKNDHSEEAYGEAVSLIKTLKIDPGLEFANTEGNLVEPELLVKKVGTRWKVSLIEKFASRLKINSEYQALIRENKKNKEFTTLQAKLQEAKWFLSGLQRRNETLLKVGEYLMQSQVDFLERGPGFIKPMNIIDVSSRVSMHESTVSRVTNGKYIATPWGMFELKHFLPSSLHKKDGGLCSSLSAKELIKELVEAETRDHVLSDDEIANQLKAHGIQVARRTIAKYRESLNILPSYQRVRVKFHQT